MLCWWCTVLFQGFFLVRTKHLLWFPECSFMSHTRPEGKFWLSPTQGLSEISKWIKNQWVNQSIFHSDMSGTFRTGYDFLYYNVNHLSGSTDWHECGLMTEWERNSPGLPVSCGGGTGRGSAACKSWWTADRRDPLRCGVEWLDLTRNIPVLAANRSWEGGLLWEQIPLKLEFVDGINAKNSHLEHKIWSWGHSSPNVLSIHHKLT